MCDLLLINYCLFLFSRLFLDCSFVCSVLITFDNDTKLCGCWFLFSVKWFLCYDELLIMLVNIVYGKPWKCKFIFLLAVSSSLLPHFYVVALHRDMNSKIL